LLPLFRPFSTPVIAICNNQNVTSTLQDRLDAITENTRALVQPERLAVVDQVIAEVFSTGVEDRVLPVGATMPAFARPDSNNRIVRSEDLLSLGPLIVKFFRGRWCPYCITELETWVDLYPELRRRGALLVAISPQTLRQNDFAVQQHKFPFPLLRDANCEFAQQLGLVWTLPQYYRDYLRGILINIPFINGDLTSRTTGYRPGLGAFQGPDANPDAVWRMPLPATFAVLPDGKIAFSQAHADFRVRPEPMDVLNSF
jgi:peroxiredoxin